MEFDTKGFAAVAENAGLSFSRNDHDATNKLVSLTLKLHRLPAVARGVSSSWAPSRFLCSTVDMQRTSSTLYSSYEQ